MLLKRNDILQTLDSDSLDKEQALLIASDLKSMNTALRGVLTDAKPRVCACIAEYLHLLSRGYYHRVAIQRSGAIWPQINSFKAHYPAFATLYDTCKESSEDVRQQLREETLDKRAMRGWLEPVYHKGVKCGVIRRFSDKCLEIAVKGGDKTGKFADKQKVEHEGQVIHYHLHNMPKRGSYNPETKTIDVNTDENATKTQLEGDNDQNTE